jgi:hypothetical protein
MCPLCELAQKAAPSDRRCAFDEQGVFRSDNLNCGTMHALRIQAYFAVTTLLGGEPPTFARGVLLGYAGAFVQLFWKDQSVRTDHAIVLRTDGVLLVEPLKLDFARELLGSRPRRGH